MLFVTKPSTSLQSIFHFRDNAHSFHDFVTASKLPFRFPDLSKSTCFFQNASTSLTARRDWILRFLRNHGFPHPRRQINSLCYLIISLKFVGLVHRDLDRFWHLQRYGHCVLFFHTMHLMRKSFLRLEAFISTVHDEPDVKAHDYQEKGD